MVDRQHHLLERAAHVREQGLANVLLIRGDAQALPFAGGSLGKINCSGGFHELPDPRSAIREIGRVGRPGLILTASTFAAAPADRRARIKRWSGRRYAIHFPRRVWLGAELAAAGFRDYRHRLPGGRFGCVAARLPKGGETP